MTTYYLDPTATPAGGSDTGADWTNAWSTLQRAIDGTNGTQPTAGDTVLMRGTETVTVQIDLDGNSGSLAVGKVNFIGVNASGVNDGTRYVLSASGSISVISLPSTAPASFLNFENIEITGTTGTGFYSNSYAYASHHSWQNIYIHNCGTGINVNTRGIDGCLFSHCRIENNTSVGLTGASFAVIFSNITGNGGGGISSNSAHGVGMPALIYGCLIEGNTGDGLVYDGWGTAQGLAAVNNVIDGNTGTGINIATAGGVLIGNRITNQTGAGVTLTKEMLMAYNYMPDTAQDRVNGSKTATNTPIYLSDKAGADSNNLSGTDTNAGYNSPTTSDFNLVSGASMRDVAVDLDG